MIVTTKRRNINKSIYIGQEMKEYQFSLCFFVLLYGRRLNIFVFLNNGIIVINF